MRSRRRGLETHCWHVLQVRLGACARGVSGCGVLHGLGGGGGERVCARRRCVGGPRTRSLATPEPRSSWRLSLQRRHILHSLHDVLCTWLSTGVSACEEESMQGPDLCVGTLIHPQWVLTLAPCVEEAYRARRPVSVVLGTVNNCPEYHSSSTGNLIYVVTLAVHVVPGTEILHMCC